MANVYSPESIGIKPPAGGFKQGGWYSGRQFWAGTLSEPGAIHPQSDQPGAGQPVSPEVIAQTDPRNVAYIEEQRRKAAEAGVAPAAAITPTPTPAVAGAPTPAVTGAEVPGVVTPETIDLPELYKSLYAEAGIEKLEAKYSEKEREFIEAKAKINDNPFLSEATRVGRIAKLETLFAERTANLQRDILTKKADVETQLNLQTQQFNIESTAAQQALSRLNTLLNMEALDNASGETIASLTRSTGISSDMIYSAIQENKKKKISTSLVTVDDGTNISGVLVNTNTGEIIKSTVLGKSKPRAPKAVTEAEKTSYYQGALREDAARGVNLDDIFKLYTGYLDPNTIYGLYNTNSLYGAAKEIETPEGRQKLRQYGVSIGAESGYSGGGTKLEKR